MPTFERPHGIELSYADFGDPEAPAVVFLHAAASDQRMWAPHIGPFSRDYRVITPDLRGHGASTAPAFVPPLPDALRPDGRASHPYDIEAFADDLLALLDGLEIPVCALVGTGFGGMVALQFATSAPERVAGLVLSDTSAAPYNDAYDDSYGAEEAERRGAVALVERFGPAELGKRAAAGVADPFLAAGLRARYAQLQCDGYLGAAHAAQTRPDLLPIIAERLTMPVLICIGKQDPGRSASEVMASSVPHARVVTFNDTGHGIPVQRPDAFGKAVFAFFRDIEDAHGA